MAPENTDRKQAGRFQPGRSGNPSGRPRGARNATTIAIETLLDGEAARLTKKAIEMALAGDVVAMRLCLERICPPKKGSPVAFPLRLIYTAQDAADALADVAAAVAAGEITPSDADAISSVLSRAARAFEATHQSVSGKTINDYTDAQLLDIISRGTSPELAAQRRQIANKTGID
ncbi:DUF5681 domain-containing protein [Bradyrhizobium sp. 613_E4_N2_2]|uniref:DUF5681 domain-containing protein n=1 Tax=Bradyrhizobium sp. 613_E4_N2_2 TaxID=3240371 RepID=UPI003F89F797